MEAITSMKIGTNVYGVIYGKGVITNVFTNSFYKFEVTYENGDVIFYTEDGVPGWGLKHGLQTVYNIEDVNIIEHDISPSVGPMSMKKIIKYIMDETIEIKCPSGVWRSVSQAPQVLVDKYLMTGSLHLFRRSKNVETKKHNV